MNDELFVSVERQLAVLHPQSAPRELRATVLADVERELWAARWDRRLVRAAGLLLAIGAGLNLAIGLQSTGSRDAQQPRFTRTDAQRSLLDTAVVVAEATDAATGSRYARQLAAMAGRELTDDEAAAIDAAIERAATHATTNGNKG